MGRSATHKSPIFPESGELRRKKAEISPPLPAAPSSVSRTDGGGFGIKVTREDKRMVESRALGGRVASVRFGRTGFGSLPVQRSGISLFFSGLLFLFHFIPFLAFVYIFHALVALPCLGWPPKAEEEKGPFFGLRGR